jgi:predicted nucleic acid-binding protein
VPELSAAVVDASVLVELVANGSRVEQVKAVFHDPDLHLPGHCDAEVLGAIHGLVRRDVLTGHAARSAIRRLGTMPAVRHHVFPLLQRAWDLRVTTSLSDALYISLAMHLELPLVTADGGQAASARAVGVRVVHIEGV